VGPALFFNRKTKKNETAMRKNKEGCRSVWEWEKGLVSVNSNSHRVYGTL
jgi:hypothetical protein